MDGADEVDAGVGVGEVLAVLERVQRLVDDVGLPQPQAGAAPRVQSLRVPAQKVRVDDGAVEGEALVELAVLDRRSARPFL